MATSRNQLPVFFSFIFLDSHLPHSGRGGYNVMLYNGLGELMAKTAGKWDQDKDVYQELCELPNFEGDYVQVCSWAVSGKYGGTVLRVDETKIIGYESAVYPLRIIKP